MFLADDLANISKTIFRKALINTSSALGVVISPDVLPTFILQYSQCKNIVKGLSGCEIP